MPRRIRPLPSVFMCARAVDDAEAQRRWQAVRARSSRLSGIAERAEAGQQLAYADWALRLLPHLKALGPWGHSEFYWLSVFDPRYEFGECEDKFDSFDGGP